MPQTLGCLSYCRTAHHQHLNRHSSRSKCNADIGYLYNYARSDIVRTIKVFAWDRGARLPYMLSLTMVQSRSETRMKRCGCERTFDAMFPSLTAPLLFTSLATANWYRSPHSQGVKILPGVGPTRAATVRCGARNSLVTFNPIYLA